MWEPRAVKLAELVQTLAPIRPRSLIMSVRKSVVLFLCLVGGLANSADAGQLSQVCCGNQPGWTGCDHTCFGCETSCDPSCHMCRRCCVSSWCRLHCLDSTCDMHPHYAYYPENHGYYYYRPYNWEHYGQDTPRLLGLGYAAPYSEDGFRELKPTTVIAQPALIPPSKKSLPNLEDLLRK